MFIVYHSNKSYILKDIMINLIKNFPLQNPFKSEIILVQNNYISQWIQLEITNKLGISANINFLFPHNFIWKIFFQIYNKKHIKNPFSGSLIKWKLMDILISLKDKKEFTFINEYLNNDFNKEKCFYFASMVVNLYKCYLVFRPELLIDWLYNKNYKNIKKSQYWQILLWKELINENSEISKSLIFYLNIYKKIIKKKNKNNNFFSKLPKRIFIFGIFDLPPMFLQILYILSSYIDIYYLFNNPCKYFWGNFLNNNLSHHLLKHNNYNFYKTTRLFFFYNKKNKNINNLLLNFLGKQIENNLYLLSQFKNIIEIEVFIKPTSNCLLNLLQKDILLLTNSSLINKKYCLNIKDNSFSINICNDEYHEIEILHDNLLSMIKEDSTLNLNDIIVIISDINRYLPSIKAIFGDYNKKYYLPYTIYNRNIYYFNDIISTVINLIKLPHIKFTVDEIISFLEIPSLGLRFFIYEKELNLLRKCIINNGIYWGLDYDTYYKFMLSDIDFCNWQHGLNNILMKYILIDDNNDDDHISYIESDEFINNLVSNLMNFFIKLRYWRDWLSKPRYLNSWKMTINNIINNFFVINDKEKNIFNLLNNEWIKIIKYGLQIKYNKLILITLIKKEFFKKIKKIKKHKKYSINNIVFCDFLDLNPIPFRIVCLIGMNTKDESIDLFNQNYNLMINKPRFGDPNKNNKDKYLFLNSLLSAQQKIYISYINESINNNIVYYPSVLIKNLIDYILNNFIIINNKINFFSDKKNVYNFLCKKHNKIQNFLDKFYFKKYYFISNNILINNFNKNEKIDSFVKKLPKINYKKIFFKDLLNFYKHPVKFWFQKRLGIYFKDNINTSINDELFIINNLKNYQISKKLLNIVINNKNPELLYNYMYKYGQLLHKSFSKIYWNKLYKIIYNLSIKINKYKLSSSKNFEFILKFNNIKLIVDLLFVQNNGLLRWQPRSLSTKDGLLLWLEHLVYCIAGGNGKSRIFGTFGEWCFPNLSMDIAKENLFLFILGFQNGINKPLLLLNRSGGSWLNYCYNPLTKNINFNKNKQIKAKNKLIQSWQGNNFILGDKNDPYLQKVINKINKKYIIKIINAAKCFFLPFYKFNKSFN